MHLRDVIPQCGPWPMVVDVHGIAPIVAARGGGARVYMTRSAVRRRWYRDHREPRGAAEMVAAEIEQAVLASGGTMEHVERVLTMTLGGYLWI